MPAGVLPPGFGSRPVVQRESETLVRAVESSGVTVALKDCKIRFETTRA